VVWFVDPAVRDSGEEDPDFVLFCYLCDYFAGAWWTPGLREKRWTVQSFGIVVAVEFGRRLGLCVCL
jgi:hypothetical protein